MFLKQLDEICQAPHEVNLLKKCAEYEEIILTAPTGAGKTVLVSKFIDDYLDENPKTVFLWLCPGAGGLEKQSQDSFEESTSGIHTGDVYSFIGESDPAGCVFFINWDKINKSSNVVLREGEHKDLMSKVWECHNSGIEIFMLIDEEHKYKETANEYVNNIHPKHVLRISATPISKGDFVERIPDDEVIASGLIASGISVNEGMSKALEENDNLDNDLLLLDLADEKRKEIRTAYEKLNLNIRPLVLIQFPNGSEDWIKRIKQRLEDLGYPESSGLVASWFSGDHPENPEEIKKLDGQYAFLLFKQAIATGWDCPRAKILVKLREGGTERFNIQTVGRIRRMPERHHYDNPLLDYCYLYTLDSQFKEGLTNSLDDSFYTYQLKKRITSNLHLKKICLNGSDLFAVNPEKVVTEVRKHFLAHYDINHDGKLDKKEMELSKGYVFGTKLKTSSFEGVARTASDILKLSKRFEGEHQIDNHEDGFIIRDAKRRIASAMGIEENISNNVLELLFGPLPPPELFTQEEIAFAKANKLIEGLSRREYNAFLINNKDLLIEALREISEDPDKIGDFKQTDLLVLDWDIPRHQYYKLHKKIPSSKFMSKNAFEGYGSSILLPKNRTVTERTFEEWCENYDSVEWVYKNGDKGEDFFSVVYQRGFRRNNFYPDYIIRLKNGDVWIIEAKGGITPEGESNNIDRYAAHKFAALAEYAKEHPEVKWGFVRAIGIQLYISNTVWCEDPTNQAVWRPIEEFI